MSRYRSSQSRERLIWGELAHVDVPFEGPAEGHDHDAEQVDDDPEAQELKQARPRRHRKKSRPPRILSSRENSPSSSQSVELLSPRPLGNVTPRRPRGADVGKSIHKAAQARQASSRSAFRPSSERRRSLGSAKRIVASLPPGQSSEDDVGRHSSANSATSSLRKAVPERAASRRRTRLRSVGLGRKSDSNRSRLASHPSLGNAGTRLRRTPSPVDSAYQVQLARKTASRKEMAGRENSSTHDPILNHQRLKAARKRSTQQAGYPLFDNSDSGSLGDSSSSGSDNEDDRSSSSSSSARRFSDHFSTEVVKIESKAEEALQDEATPDGVMGQIQSTQIVSNMAQLQLLEHGPSSHAPSPRPDGVGTPARLEEGRIRSPSASRVYSNNSENLGPPQALLSAFQEISAYTVYLHAQNRLPFLLRNVRKTFRLICRNLRVGSQSDRVVIPSKRPDVILTFEYVDPTGISLTYNTEIRKWECPLCSILGNFSSWETLNRHIQWDHGEVELEAKMVDSSRHEVESVVVRLRSQSGTSASREQSERMVPRRMTSVQSTSHHAPSGAEQAETYNGPSPYMPSDDPQTLFVDVPSDEKVSGYLIPVDGPTLNNQKSEIVEPHNSRMKKSSSTSSLSTSPPELHAGSRHATTSLETSESNYRQYTMPENGPRHSSVIRSIPVSGPASHAEILETQSPHPPPLSDRHGPSLPVSSSSGHPLGVSLPTTYRPTGPHLYDRLPPLPPDVFGSRSWFVLDKEEEIFELTDVLDEDKVMCALWGRWILLNRSFFIANYFLGVEAFVSEYWPLIHQAAGWGALRAWLLMLVSRRFLKNIEMVQVMKKYNGLVGKSNWPK